MKFFIDTANIEEIRKAASWGIIDGVTTNPTLIAKEGRDFREMVLEITHIIDGPISAEIISENTEGMITEAEQIASWHPNIVIKIPMTQEGIRAVRILNIKAIKTNVTLVFSANQALIAAKAGATFVSPFVGRLDDVGHDGMDIVSDIIDIYDTYGFTTEVIVASIRHPLHVLIAAKLGAHIATIPFKVLEQLFKHPLTDIGIERFLTDWHKME